MHFSKDEKNTLVSIICLVIAIGIFISVFLIPARGRMIQSARLMPLIICSLMLGLSILLFIKNVRKACPGPGLIWGVLKSTFSDKETNQVTLSIVICGFYCFVAVPYIGFYISSFTLILLISLFYVRRLNPILAILTSLACTGFFYVVFAIIFRMPLR